MTTSVKYSSAGLDMTKLMILIKNKDGQEREDFIAHYENVHVPLITRHVGHCILDCRRNYIDWNDPLSVAAFGSPEKRISM